MFRIGIKAPLAAFAFYLRCSQAQWEDEAGRVRRLLPISAGMFPITRRSRAGPVPANGMQLTRLCAATPRDPHLPALDLLEPAL